jgi:hypothetical protein
LSDVSVAAGVTVSWADWVAPPPVPEIVTVVDVVTGLVVTANVAVVLPAGTVTPPGTVAAAALLLESATTTPPAGAAPFSTAVPTEEAPPETLVGARLIEIRAAGMTVAGMIVSEADRVAPPAVA